jgi:hypothetical protein
MFKAIREFFLGKPAQAPEVAVPYKVEAPAPEAFTPPPKAADVVVEAPVPAVTNGVGNVPLGNGSSAVTDSLLSVKPEPTPAPAKKPAARRRPAAAKKPVAKRAPAKKPVAK